MPPNPASNPNPPVSKEQWRRCCRWPEFAAGQLAQTLRRQDFYRRSRRLLVGPGRLLSQLRINALLDGKELLLPAPALRDGFYLFRPYTIPFTALSQAVTYQGLHRYGRRLATAELRGLEVDLLLDQALAAELGSGLLLAQGEGFFDLSLAILATAGALAAEHRLVGVPGALVVGPGWPADPWDVRADYLLSPGHCQPCHHSPAAGDYPLFPEQLEPTRLRRLTPVWQLLQ
ncbi:MAG: 5-formyltetrahydrofolate cyclo-ligase [Desulfurivibrio sp.]|nr:5-formyltetrahydrofolate cyclo-ligase [Desulfurivibrio sp.]